MCEFIHFLPDPKSPDWKVQSYRQSSVRTTVRYLQWCWWLKDDGDNFKMLVTETLCWWLFSICWLLFQCIESVTHISKLPTTHFVSNIRHKHLYSPVEYQSTLMVFSKISPQVLKNLDFLLTGSQFSIESLCWWLFQCKNRHKHLKSIIDIIQASNIDVPQKPSFEFCFRSPRSLPISYLSHPNQS